MQSPASRSKASGKQPGHRRSRGLTCANCRGRKVRCDGRQPTCKSCEVYNDECHYDKAPPLSQVMAMAKQLQEAQKMIERLRAERSTSSNGDTGWQAPAQSIANPSPPSFANQVNNPSQRDPPPPNVTIISPEPIVVEDSWGAAPVDDPSEPKQPTAEELTVDEHGKITYYGPTSAVHDPPRAELVAPQTTPDQPNGSSWTDTRNSLATYRQEVAVWEEFALGNASLQTGIPKEVMAKLLHIHWTWVSPMFMWVYRPAFIRDMATGGRYYSEFLLTVICAHAAKYEKGGSADFLLTRARRLLGTAIQQPSSIPTVQALLQLSARDLAHGSISQAWVYSGIAFRMASDLGLQHSSNEVKGLSPVDLEIRKRLFWSCYFWDKATSLYAGRLPTVTELSDHMRSSLDLLDHSADLDIWTPYFGDSLNLVKSSAMQYPPTSGHVVSSFVNSCKLSIIINDIIIQLYYRRGRSMTESSFSDIKARLERWRAQSPSHLKFDPDHLPSICPPPHLVSQNMLYFASVILAHRPVWSAPAHYQICISASQSIEKLVLLLEATFSLDNITYLMGYCIYTGASAILEDAKKGSASAHATLQTFLRALNAGMRRCPLLERSLKIIVKGMSHARRNEQSTMSEVGAGETPTAANGYIPAFPYINSSAPFDFDMNPYLTGTDFDTIPMLDCFPEMQMDMSGFLEPMD